MDTVIHLICSDSSVLTKAVCIASPDCIFELPVGSKTVLASLAVPGVSQGPVEVLGRDTVTA